MATIDKNKFEKYLFAGENEKGTTTHSKRYEQQIIFYNKNNESVNILVAWIESDRKIRMTTAYITEVK